MCADEWQAALGHTRVRLQKGLREVRGARRLVAEGHQVCGGQQPTASVVRTIRGQRAEAWPIEGLQLTGVGEAGCGDAATGFAIRWDGAVVIQVPMVLGVGRVGVIAARHDQAEGHEPFCGCFGPALSGARPFLQYSYVLVRTVWCGRTDCG